MTGMVNHVCPVHQQWEAAKWRCQVLGKLELHYIVRFCFKNPNPKELKEKKHFDGICGFVFSLWKRKESKNKSWYVTRKVLATCHTGLRRVKSLLRDYIRFTDNGVLNLKLQVCNNRASEHFSIWSIWWIFFSKDRFCLPSFIQFFHILLQLI